MIHKLLAGKGKMKRGLSLLLCLALLGCSVISSNVTAEAESDVTAANTAETTEETGTGSAEDISDTTITASVSTNTSSAAEAVQAMIDALPSVEELSTMTTEEQLEVYYATLEADEAYQALSDEEKESVDDSLLDELFAYFNGETATITTYTESYSVQAGSSTTISERSYGQNLTISSYSVAVTSGEEDGVTVGYSTDWWGSTSTTSLTVTGVTAGTVVTINVTYSNGDTGTYTVTVTGKSYSGHIDLRLVEGSFEYTETTTESTTYSITVDKVWDDNGVDHSADSVTVYLIDSGGARVTDSEGNEISEATLDASNEWTYTWESLSLAEGTYNVVEKSVTGYTTTMSDSVTVAAVGSTTSSETVYGTIEITSVKSLTYTHDGSSYTLTTYTSQNGNDGKEFNFQISSGLTDGDVITVVLTYTVTYTDAEGNVLYDSDGKAITKEFKDQTFTHTVAAASNECKATGYDFHVDPTGIYSETQDNVIESSVTVTNTPTTVDIPVEKIWSEDDGYTSLRSSVTVELYAGDEATGETLTLSEGNSWSGTFSNLTEYDLSNGASGATKITYSVKEISANSYYDVSYGTTTDETTGVTTLTVTNTLKKTDISVKKTVGGNMGDKTKSFSFSYVVKTADELTTLAEGTFNLSDYDTSEVLELIEGLPVGSVITLTETNNTGYSVTFTYGDTTSTTTTATADGVSYSFIIDDTNNVIEVTNDYSIEPDTGINLDSAPYILMLAGVAILGGVVLFRRRRKLL